MQTLIKNPSEIYWNEPKIETLGTPVVLWEALGTILTPKATQRQKRPEDTGSLVAFGPPFLCPLGPLFGTGTSHGAVCVVFWGSFFEASILIDFWYFAGSPKWRITWYLLCQTHIAHVVQKYLSGSLFEVILALEFYTLWAKCSQNGQKTSTFDPLVLALFCWTPGCRQGWSGQSEDALASR